MALIVGVVDVFDALVSERPYRRRLLPHEAVKELLVADTPENDPPTGGGKPKTRKTTTDRKPSNVIAFQPATQKHEVVALLEKVGSVGSNQELADLLGCSAGEAFKRRQEVADLIEEGWQNRCRTIRLKA